MSIEVRNIHKAFGDFIALGDVSLEFPSGELVALLGPSGCGKTTLLRIIAGLESADRGQVLLDGEDASGTHVRERQVGFVFQHYALFRHMTVFDNVAFGLRVKPRKARPPEAVIKKKVHDLLDLVQLGWLANHVPAQLSGGQRKRVALARAVVLQPRVVLYDEPTTGLDPIRSDGINELILKLKNTMGVTGIVVTHDLVSARKVADRCVLLLNGKVAADGTYEELENHPEARVRQFLIGRYDHEDEDESPRSGK